MAFDLDEFELMVEEVERYFDFLKGVIGDHVVISRVEGDETHEQTIDKETQKILKANAFLILYNLVEATIRLGVTGIYREIEHEGLRYKEVSEEIKSVWIDVGTRNLNRGAGIDKIRKTAKDLVESVADDVAVKFEGDKLPSGSGNLDAEKVRKLAKRIGFSAEVAKEAHGGHDLGVIRDKRNALAHGNVSFGECGRDYDLPALQSMKGKLVAYLRSIVRNMQVYANGQQYRRENRRTEGRHVSAPGAPEERS